MKDSILYSKTDLQSKINKSGFEQAAMCNKCTIKCSFIHKNISYNFSIGRNNCKQNDSYSFVGLFTDYLTPRKQKQVLKWKLYALCDCVVSCCSSSQTQAACSVCGLASPSWLSSSSLSSSSTSSYSPSTSWLAGVNEWHVGYTYDKTASLVLALVGHDCDDVFTLA